jgi:hypothetical protein
MSNLRRHSMNLKALKEASSPSELPNYRYLIDILINITLKLRVANTEKNLGVF